MQEYSYNNLEEFLNNWQNNSKYFEMLRLMAQLSKLFSLSKTPYLDYRLAENLFCRYFSAQNDARSCTAYDARLCKVGIGIKTFILKGKDDSNSIEKIAEFNKLRVELNELAGIDLAKKLGTFRNERMQFANNLYDITETQYHIVGRATGCLRIFNTPYEEVNIDRIHLIKDDETSCSFHDEINEYTFNKSKSVLQKRFCVPKICKNIEVEIIDEPLELLEKLFAHETIDIQNTKKTRKGIDYIILPLYSESKAKGRFVPEKSGLNQFNAGGRARNELEVYIPVPKYIHKNFPDFFPSREESFLLHLPNGSVLSAKICQDGGKALMSNPNKDLGEWILRTVLKKRPMELVSITDLDRLGFDSVCIENLHSTDENGVKEYKISLSDNNNYANFRDEDITLKY